MIRTIWVLDAIESGNPYTEQSGPARVFVALNAGRLTKSLAHECYGTVRCVYKGDYHSFSLTRLLRSHVADEAHAPRGPLDVHVMDATSDYQAADGYHRGLHLWLWGRMPTACPDERHWRELIRAAADVTPFLVFADWLEERHGDSVEVRLLRGRALPSVVGTERPWLPYTPLTS